LGFVVTLLLERSGVRPSFNISNFPKVKHPGYQYDALGRNTQIPAADAPNNNGIITLAYNTNDQVTQISQAGATTNFSYEAEGRRLNETSGNTTTTRHYTDGSDNPTWTTQAAVNVPNTVTKTEIYTPSLGSGLNVTTTIQNGTLTGSVQLHDLRGNTVTTIDLTTNTATSWCTYDEFGNQDSSNPANTNLISYSTYAGAERATNATGLILMGARVYNPETNQFTSPDPVQGGNENSYTYPNDPINMQDLSGRWGFWVDLAVGLLIGGLTAAACGATAGIACPLIVGGVLSAINGAASAGNDADQQGLTGQARTNAVLGGALEGVITNTVGLGVGKLAKPYLDYVADAGMLSRVGRAVARVPIKKGKVLGALGVRTAIRTTAEYALSKVSDYWTTKSIRAIEDWHKH
jgi:RHS repeat-associated protein